MANRRTSGPNQDDSERGYADTAMEFPSELWTSLHGFSPLYTAFSLFSQVGSAYTG